MDRDSKCLHMLYEQSLLHEQKKEKMTWSGDVATDVNSFLKFYPHVEPSRKVFEWAIERDFRINPVTYYYVSDAVNRNKSKDPDKDVYNYHLQMQLMFDLDKGTMYIDDRDPTTYNIKDHIEHRMHGTTPHPDKYIDMSINFGAMSLPARHKPEDLTGWPKEPYDPSKSRVWVPYIDTDTMESMINRHVVRRRTWTNRVHAHFKKLYYTQDPDWKDTLDLLNTRYNELLREVKQRVRRRRTRAPDMD